MKKIVLIMGALFFLVGCGEKKKEEVAPCEAGKARTEAGDCVTEKKVELTVLVQGSYSWMGNDTYVSIEDVDEDGISIYHKGAYRAVKEALSKIASIATMAIPAKNAVGQLLVYGNDVKSLYQGSITDKDKFASTLGLQRAFYEGTLVDLAKGIQKASEILSGKADANTRRILLVLGSGEVLRPQDTERIKSLTAAMRKGGVEIFAIQYQRKDHGMRDIPKNKLMMRSLVGDDFDNYQSVDLVVDISEIASRFAETIKNPALAETKKKKEEVAPCEAGKARTEAGDCVTEKKVELTVLVQGSYSWMGNDTYKAPDDVDEDGISIYHKGAYRAVKEALSKIASITSKGTTANYAKLFLPRIVPRICPLKDIARHIAKTLLRISLGFRAHRPRTSFATTRCSALIVKNNKITCGWSIKIL